MVYRLSCYEACEVFLDQGSNLRLPARAGRFSTPEPGEDPPLTPDIGPFLMTKGIATRAKRLADPVEKGWLNSFAINKSAMKKICMSYSTRDFFKNKCFTMKREV